MSDLTVQELARELGCSGEQVRVLVRDGRITPTTDLGTRTRHHYRFNLASVRAELSRSEVNPWKQSTKSRARRRTV